MLKILLLVFLIPIKAQDDYERLIAETVTEEYCNIVISNLTTALDEIYVYTDYLKGPIQQEGYQVYDDQIDIIGELNKIEKKNRKFYDFYRDILKTLAKTKDGHLAFFRDLSPNNISLFWNVFCVPFRYYVEDNGTEPYLSINFTSTSKCVQSFSDDVNDKIRKVSGKKIKSINGLDPFEYIESISLIFDRYHSPQARYVNFLNSFFGMSINLHPFIKEELNLSLVFEDNDSLEIQYAFMNLQPQNKEFANFYYKEAKYNFQHHFRIPAYEEIELKYKIKKGLVSKEKLANNNWDLEENGGEYKCKIDEENEVNVFYIKSFPFYHGENNLDVCFQNFYENNYPIIIIEDYNKGGQVNFGVALAKYVQPRIKKPYITSRKATNTMLEQIFSSGQNLDPETCKPYTDKDKDDMLNGEQEIYSNGVIHHRTKNLDSSNILEKMFTDALAPTENIRKPTEIIVFTDGFSFSCGSVFIKRLQRYGSAIIVGYNARLNNQTKFDASQSNSWVDGFESNKNVINLANLGYALRITYSEEFSPNNQNENEVPEEFLIYPVDEMSKIYKPYTDEIYDRFIKEAKDIIEKYNKIDGECNPDNKYLYFETDECDNIIENGHGGYLCGTDGKWNTSNCIISYCDDGYILNDNRTQCFINPCLYFDYEKIEIDENYTELIIQPNAMYMISFIEEDSKYIVYSETEGLIYQSIMLLYNSPKENNSIVGYENTLVINYYLNLTKNATLYIKKIENTTENNATNNESNDETDQTNDETDQTNDNESRNSNITRNKKSIAAWKIILIILGSIIALLIFVVTLFLTMKKNPQVILIEQNESAKGIQN